MAARARDHKTLPEVWAVAREGEPSQPSAAELRGVDPLLAFCILGLLGFGVVMVYSASGVYAAQKFGSSDYFLRRELAYAALGVVALAIASRIDYALYRKHVYPILLATIVLLAAVLVVGARINGARRWFHLGPLSFQPGELAKLAIVIYLAHSLTKKADKVKDFKIGFLPNMLVTAVLMLLLIKQPDLGTAVVLGLAAMMLMFIAGARVEYLVMAVLAVLPVLYTMLTKGFRLQRILAYLNPFNFRYGVGYQVTQSLLAIGAGGLFGAGLGNSHQKLLFLPEAHTDYIGAIIGEELGLVGLVCVAASFVILCWRGIRASLRARDAYGCYLGFGITALFGLQAAVNLGVVLGSLPTKGLPMPLVSFGGSSMIVDLFAAGILLNISRGMPAVSAIARPSAITLMGEWLMRGGNRRRGRRVLIETAGGAVAREPEPTATIETATPEAPLAVDATERSAAPLPFADTIIDSSEGGEPR